MDYNIDELVKNIDFSENKLVNCGKILLTNKEIDVLKRYNIEYQKCNSLKEVLCLIEDAFIEDEADDDLDEISMSIAERDYYQNTNK